MCVIESTMRDRVVCFASSVLSRVPVANALAISRDAYSSHSCICADSLPTLPHLQGPVDSCEVKIADFGLSALVRLDEDGYDAEESGKRKRYSALKEVSRGGSQRGTVYCPVCDTVVLWSIWALC